MSNLRFCWEGPGRRAIPAEERAEKISRYGMDVPRIESNLKTMREQLAQIRDFHGDDQDAYFLMEGFRDTVRDITRCVPNHVANYTRLLQWCSYILHETEVGRMECSAMTMIRFSGPQKCSTTSQYGIGGLDG